jgi:Ca2+-binding RTX toxin-like protein
VSDGTQSCTATVAAGQCTITFTSSGAKSLTATYAGDPTFNGSTSAAEAHQVTGIATTTAIATDTPDPSVVGQPVTVQYSVVPSGAGTPTGNVTVSDGTDSCVGTVAAGQCTITLTSSGAKSLTASYAGDANFNASSSAAEPHQVNAADTTTAITSDTPDPSAVGESVTIAYSVAASAPGGGTPTGNVTVSDGTNGCTGTAAAGQCTITFATSGAKSLTATYAGTASFNGSTSANETHQVTGIATTTTITSDTPDPSAVGQSVTVQYSVVPSGAGTPTGNVTVSDGTQSCTATVAAGQCTITFATAGAKSLAATYAGDASFNGSTSAIEAHEVTGIATTTAITSDTPDPSVVGQAVTVQYTVVPAGAGTPTGSVTVSDGTQSCTATVAAGQCTITFATAGPKSLTAVYAGDSTFSGGTSAAEPHTVSPADTTTTITSDSPDPSSQGAAVTVQYSVTVSPPGAGAPTGNVTVSDGVNSCVATVGTGQCSITLTTEGSRTLTATYSGNANFGGSTSAGEPHTVNPPNTAPTAEVSNGQCSPDKPSGTIALALADADGNPLNLTLASNSNQTLVPNNKIVIAGSGYSRSIAVTASKKTGSATLSFDLADGTVTVPVVVTVIVGTGGGLATTGTSGTDMIFALGGNDTINGGAGSDLLCGGKGNDVLNGEAGLDILDGGDGNDTLNGGNGNDTLRGGKANDTLTGGADADLFSGGSGKDVATDLNLAEGDTQDGTVP